MTKEVDPTIKAAERLTSPSKLAFGWTQEDYCQAYELLTSPDSRGKLRSEQMKKKIGRNKKKNAPLARHLLAAARIYQPLYGERAESAKGPHKQEIKKEEGEPSPQPIHLISFTGYTAQFKSLQGLQTPWFNFKSITSMVRLGEVFDESRTLLQEAPSEQIVILIGRPEFSPKVASFLIASFEATQGKLPEEIAFMGVAQTKRKIPKVRDWLLQQLTSEGEDHSDRLIGVVSEGGSNRRLCQNIVNELVRREFIKKSLGT